MKLISITSIVCALCFTACKSSKNLSHSLNEENSNYEEASTPDEVDSLIEEIWLDLNEGQLHDLKEWLEKSDQYSIEFINREDALLMYDKAKSDFGVTLQIIADNSDPSMVGWTQFVVAKIDKDTDKRGLKTMLEDASSEIHLILELGNRWLSLEGKYVEVEYGNFEYIKK